MWNPDADGSCFFACLFAAFMHILLPDKTLPKTVRDRYGVAQLFGAAAMRRMFCEYYTKYPEDPDFVMGLISKIPDVGVSETDATPEELSTAEVLQQYALTTMNLGMEQMTLIRMIPDLKVQIETEVVGQGGKSAKESTFSQFQYINGEVTLTNVNNHKSNKENKAYTRQDPFAIRLKLKDACTSNAHYVVHVF